MVLPILNSRQLGVLDESGELVRTLGRSGEGPGEFGRIGRVGAIGEVIWAYDMALRRMTTFDSESAVTTTQVPGANLWAFVGTGGVYGRYRDTGRDADGNHRWRLEVGPEPTGASMTSLHLCRTSDAFQRIEVAGVRAQVPMPWGSRCPADVGPRHSTVAVLEADGSEVHIIDVGNGRTHVVKLDLAQGEVTSAFVDRWIELVLEGDNTPPNLGAEIRSRLAPPRHLPMAVDVRLAGPDTFWVALGTDVERRSWVRFDRGRATVGVRFTREGRLLYASRTHLWVLERAELDVPELVRYRVVLPDEG